MYGLFSNILITFALHCKSMLMKIRDLMLGIVCCVFPVNAQTLSRVQPSTIDPSLQTLGERLMSMKQGSIIAIEPQTGAIRCLVSSSWEPDTINRAISIAYSPGSTFKVAQTLVLESEGIINEETSYTCHEGFWRKNIHIGCHRHPSPQKLIGAIGHSCNSYFCKAFMSIIDNRTNYSTQEEAINTWHAYMSSFGLGKPLGIDLPHETAGHIPDASALDSTHRGSWNALTIMWIGMGQGEVTATPLQLCNLAALIANRGWWRVPHVHKPSPTRAEDAKYVLNHYIQSDSASMETVIKGMRLCVSNGTAKSIDTPLFEICGKTGTAENHGTDHSVFIGFAPMNQPQIAVCVYIENGGFGADLAAPIAALIMEQSVTGKLSPRSEHHAQQWEQFPVVPTYDETEDPFYEVMEEE